MTVPEVDGITGDAGGDAVISGNIAETIVATAAAPTENSIRASSNPG